MAYTNSSLATYKLISPNKNSPRNHALDTITIHCYVGQVTAERGCNGFYKKSRKASCNYVVGYDGSIGLCVDEKDRSWCTSSSSNDNRAVTIEVASDTKEPYAVTDKAYNALINLVTDICKRNGIKQLIWSENKTYRMNHMYGCNMTVHRDYAAKACPGTYLYERHGQIANEVNKRLGSTSSDPVVTDSKPASTTKTAIEVAKYKSTAYSKAYTVNAKAGLNLRVGAGTNKTIIKTLPYGTKVKCYGYYNKVGNTIWLYVSANGTVGYVSKDYLK